MRRAATCLISIVLLVGCAKQSPIVRYGESKSHFSQEPELMSNDVPKKDIYRVFHQAGSGFVSLQSIREDAEKRATDFCSRQGKEMQALGERTSSPPYILGNFPKIEICFACLEKKATAKPAQEVSKDLYTEIMKLEDLRKRGLLTDAEFEAQKKKLLNGGQ